MRARGRDAKRKRDRKYKRKLKRLYSFGLYNTAIYYVDADYPYRVVNKPYYVKSYKSRGKHKGRFYTYKREANRKIRHYNSALPNGSAYKKLYDLWWQIY
ncbi:MAG TPA: hypothetical protein DCW90_22875 [Lachnospiraceae bacterium]|nr:hypothetical protein [Lachnospiraceae bacterium]